MQLANYAAFPLQIILFFPFLKLGETVSKVSLDPLSKIQLISAFDEGIFYAIEKLSNYLLVAVLPIYIVLYFLMSSLLKKFEPFLSNISL